MSEFDLLQILAIPFAVVFLSLVVLWRPWRGEAKSFSAWAPPLSVAVGYALVHTTISSFPSLPAVTADEWLVYVAIGAGLWGAVEGGWQLWQSPWAYAGRLAVVGGGFWIMFGERVGIGWCALVVVTVLLWMSVGDRLSRKEGGVSAPWVVMFSAAALGAILVLGASLKLAILAWGVMAIMLASGLVSMVGRIRSATAVKWSPMWPVVCVILAGLGLNGVEFAQASPAAVVGTLVVIPAAIGASAGLVGRRGKGWKAATIAVSLAAVGASVAGGYAYYEAEIVEEEVKAEADEEYDPYSW